tara:strand:+ start:139 stop:378 length:240 start_codon:yes stop_codon:yes gene_type:complete
MTNLVQTFELWLERKINETIDAYLEANPLNSELDEDRVKKLAREEAADINDDRVRELAREEANDAINNADYDIDISVSA